LDVHGPCTCTRCCAWVVSMDFEALLLGGQCKRAVRWRLQMARPSDLHGVRKSGYRLQCAIKCQTASGSQKCCSQTGLRQAQAGTVTVTALSTAGAACDLTMHRSRLTDAPRRRRGGCRRPGGRRLERQPQLVPDPRSVAARLARATPGRATPGPLPTKPGSTVARWMALGCRWPDFQVRARARHGPAPAAPADPPGLAAAATQSLRADVARVLCRSVRQL
jgi:hypothetical protein